MHRPKPRKSSKRKQQSHGQRTASAARTDAPPPRGPIHVTSRAAFERHLAGEQPVIVDFWAPWCGPCKAMSPVFDRVAQQLGDQVRFLKVNTEQLPELASAFGIRSIPTLLVLQGGEVINSNVGLTGESNLAQMAQKAIDRASGVTFTDRVKRLFGRGPAAQQA